MSNEVTDSDTAFTESWSAREIIIAVVAFLVIIALSVGGYLLYQGSKPPVVVEGSMAPDFTFPLLGGGEVSLSDYRGKVVLVNIWATSCETCKEEMPFIEKKYRELNGDSFQLLTISTDKGGEEDIRPFLEEIGSLAFDDPQALDFPVLMDTEDTVADTYQTRKYPESFIIDRDGTVKSIVLGQLQETDFFVVRELMAQ